MKAFLTVLFLIGGPMALTQLLYRIIDHKGKKTAKLIEKFPIIKQKKFLFQIGGAMGFVILFGVICMIAKIPITVFFVVSGIVVGLINGFAVTLMYNDDITASNTTKNR